MVGKSPPVTHVTSAEEGLLVTLDRNGGIDLAYIAQLYGKPEEAIIAELGDLIYHDPETQRMADRRRLPVGQRAGRSSTAAEAAGPEYARNAEALRHVQPEDVLPGDIDANLGAPWIPASDIQAFAADLFGVAALGHPDRPSEERRRVDRRCRPRRRSVGRRHRRIRHAQGQRHLAARAGPQHENAGHLRHDPERRPRGADRQPGRTLAAREKQKLIKERFKSWVFADPERTERLVRLYNDTYNNLRPRLFDGSHLDFPGMNQGITLNPHQKDAVWRGMSSGNTLLAHAVGAGKTFTMAATGMKMKQAGLVKKPMYVVPNHMLEQFAREFMQLYPNARLLVATKEDLANDRRKLLTAKIASGEWDGIIVTHSSFERIGMSKDYQERFLREQIAEYDQLLARPRRRPARQRNIIKTIEKQKARREERLKDLAAEDKKDDGLVFDELGVDHVFIDEAHYFKNLETPTKMERVAGIQTGGSERAFDLYMKARYLGEQHPGHGVTFATGTPISNTMVELYTMQRFLDPEGLRSRGIEHFDGWAATFGEVVDTMEISPDGAILAAPQPLRPLRQPAGTSADVPGVCRRADGRHARPAPPQAGRRQADGRRLPDVGGAGRPPAGAGRPLRAATQQKVDPSEDNALAITTDGRKLALDARLLSATAADLPGSKINALVGNVAAIWQKTAATRGTQMIFCDMGVNPTPWGYCVYDEVIEKLVAARHPPRADRRRRRRRFRRQETVAVRAGAATARCAC